MEARFTALRKQLDELGYRQPLILNAVPLVEKILNDLVETTESLLYYKDVAQKALEDRNNYQIGVEPYRCDNARLIGEANDLHSQLQEIEERAAETEKELQRRIRSLEGEKSNIEVCCETLRKLVRDLQLESAEKSDRILELQGIAIGKDSGRKPLVSKSKFDNVKRPNSKPSSKPSMAPTDTSVSNERIRNLTREVKILKEDRIRQAEALENVQKKVMLRDREIERLTGLLEGGRPAKALSKDYTFEVDVQTTKNSQELRVLEHEKKVLEDQLREAINKQHEAMKRALDLAERNNMLENELKDIDRIALEVEDQCNNTVRDNTFKLLEQKSTIEKLNVEKEATEKELSNVKKQLEETRTDYVEIKNENKELHSSLTSALRERSEMISKLKAFTASEKEMAKNMENLMEEYAMQKRKASELEYRLMSQGGSQLFKDVKPRRGSKSPSPPVSPSRSKAKGTRSPQKSADIDTAIFEIIEYEKRRAMNQDIDFKVEIKRLETERNFYLKEYQKLKEQMGSLPFQSDDIAHLRKSINDREEKLKRIVAENQELRLELLSMQAKLETLGHQQWDYNRAAVSVSSMKRVERERDMIKEDAHKMEEEIDRLREDLKNLHQKHMAEKQKMDEILMENDEKIRQLEIERKRLLSSRQNELQIDDYESRMRHMSADLNSHRMQNTQLRILGEQTEQTLVSIQKQLTQSEIELRHCRGKIQELENVSEALTRQVNSLRAENSTLKTSLNEIDAEKDGLLLAVDSKTEKICMLERELKTKEDLVSKTGESADVLKKKIEIYMDECAAKENALKSSTAELAALKSQLDAALAERETMLAENRRLQSDLAAAAADAQRANADLESTKKVVEDLKRQLQDYVTEIKKAEDLITHIENDRTEMLEQFRNLSHEATTLENSNHNLEHKAEQAKTQLNVSLDRISKLQEKIEAQNNTIKTFEDNVLGLTMQLNEMETHLSASKERQECVQREIQDLRELCMKLDQQKDALVRELQEGDKVKAEMQRELDALQKEQNKWEGNIEKDRSTLGHLERLLAKCREELAEQNLIGQELRTDNEALAKTITDLKQKLWPLVTVEQLSIDEMSIHHHHLCDITPANAEVLPSARKEDCEDLLQLEYREDPSVAEMNKHLESLQLDLVDRQLANRHEDALAVVNSHGEALKEDIQTELLVLAEKEKLLKETESLDYRTNEIRVEEKEANAQEISMEKLRTEQSREEELKSLGEELRADEEETGKRSAAAVATIHQFDLSPRLSHVKNGRPSRTSAIIVPSDSAEAAGKRNRQSPPTRRQLVRTTNLSETSYQVPPVKTQEIAAGEKQENLSKPSSSHVCPKPTVVPCICCVCGTPKPKE